jgi:hypothetical protein
MRNRFSTWLDQAGLLAVVSLSLVAAFVLRFDFSIPPGAIPVLLQSIWIAVLVKAPAFHLAGSQRSCAI